ncbi:Hypothetical predicted protein [Mytilus galloprovincialis]|uniref:Uncharacterized protein n=1 Tax=Mytilus galloprovincialis TaxID=29158 RepID=A0A8B6FG23_MYTGA|nr:Hypothetical predicted protein [Mytilus galloprovincialis]
MNDKALSVIRVNVVVVGDVGVGKSSLVLRFTKNDFDDYVHFILGAMPSRRILGCKDKSVVFTISEIAGTESFPSLFYRDAGIALILYDISSHQSFENVESWQSQIQQYGPQNLKCALIGNKVDLDGNVTHAREVQSQRKPNSYRQKGAKERHAKLGVFVLRLFPTIVQLILKDNITPGKLKRMFVNKTLNTVLTDTDVHLMKMLPNMDSFTIEICYKILRFENLIEEPKCKWGNIPHETEINIEDDIQRILNASNEVITKTSEEITQMFCDSFQDNVKRIINRVDEYLNGDTCQQSFQNLHIQQIAISELLKVLEEILQKQPFYAKMINK